MRLLSDRAVEAELFDPDETAESISARIVVPVLSGVLDPALDWAGATSVAGSRLGVDARIQLPGEPAQEFRVWAPSQGWDTVGTVADELAERVGDWFCETETGWGYQPRVAYEIPAAGRPRVPATAFDKQPRMTALTAEGPVALWRINEDSASALLADSSRWPVLLAPRALRFEPDFPRPVRMLIAGNMAQRIAEPDDSWWVTDMPAVGTDEIVVGALWEVACRKDVEGAAFGLFGATWAAFALDG